MKAVNLFSHNEKTFENIITAFDSGKNAICIQPTGTGKSFILLKLCQHYSDKKMLVIEPNRYIIQTVSSKAKEYGIDNIEFVTYQKLIRMNKEEVTAIQADIIALDEAHRIEAKQWNKAVTYLTDTHSDSRIALLTATPTRMDGKNIKESFSGEVVCETTLGDAIVSKILPAPIYISALYTFDEEIAKAQKRIDESMNSAEEKEKLTKQLEAAKRKLELSHGVSEILQRHIKSKSGKYIVFCQNIEHLNTMKPVVEEWFNKAGFETHIYTVHSKMAGKDKEFLAFKNDDSDCIRLLFSVDILNEGIHLPDISGVIMLRPTQSNIIYLQQLGRALNAGTSNNPIVFDLIDNVSSNTRYFKIEIRKAIKRRNEIYDNSDCKEREEFDLKDFHIFDYVQETMDFIRLIDKKCKNSFDHFFQMFLKYKEKWGTGYVEKKKAEEFLGFYEWINHIKCSYKRNELNQERINLLKDNGFIFSMAEFGYEQLEQHIQAYIEEKKTNIIPRIYICNDGYRLGAMIHSAKNPNHYAHDLIKRYNICHTFDGKWESNYLILKQFVNEHGIEKLTTDTVYQGYNIGSWVANQRTRYKNKTLQLERVQMLSDIGIVFDVRKSNWNKFIKNLSECLKQNTKIVSKMIFNNMKIGWWLGYYKDRYKKGNISTEQYLQLKALGIDLAKKGSLM
jgi:helicase, putative